MTSVADLVQKLKTGVISKAAFMEQMSSPEVLLSDFHRGNEPDPKLKLDFSAVKSSLTTDSYVPCKQLANSTRPSSSFSIRQDQWLSRRSLSQAKLKDAKNKAEAKVCTFQPKITNRAVAKEGSFKRLTTSKSQLVIDRKRAELKQKESFEALKECTFQPEINPKSRVMSARPSSMTSPRHNQDLQRYTFTPSILGVKKSMSKASEYIQSSAFNRLTMPKARSPDPPPPPQVKSTAPRPIPYNSEFVNQPFYERQASYEVKKLERYAKRMEKDPVKPIINEVSKKLVTTDFETRNREFIAKQRQPRPSYEPEYPFHPTITRLGREIKQCYSYAKSKTPEPKIETPPRVTSKTSAYSNVKSRLGLAEGTESYLSRVAQHQKDRESYAEYVKAVKLQQELTECTHCPVITEVPDYILQIAEAYAEIKQSLAEAHR